MEPNPARSIPLSDRAAQALHHGPRIDYLMVHDERTNGPEPDPGYVCLAVAENKLMWDVLDQKVNADRAVPPDALAYGDWQGNIEFREVLAGFLSRRLFGELVEACQIQIMAGAGPLVESITWTVCNPGTGVLIPTPSYAGYWFDIGARTGVVPIPAHTASSDGFAITPESLDAAAEASSVPISLLLLTNPSNPLGRILTDDEIHGAVGWARRRGIQVVINEIYGLSTYGSTPMHSAASLGYANQPDVHLVWAFSKDFSASGLRCGVLVTANEEVRRMVGTFGYFHGVSADTQHLLTTMLSDDRWLDGYLAALRSRLAASSAAARSVLSSIGISTIDSDAGIFFLADMRTRMREVTWEAEAALWRSILDGSNVNLTPGAACHIGEPGFMRVCFASQPLDVMADALERVAEVVAFQAPEPA